MISKVREALCEWKEWTEANHPEAEFVFHYQGKQVTSIKTAWNSSPSKGWAANRESKP